RGSPPTGRTLQCTGPCRGTVISYAILPCLRGEPVLTLSRRQSTEKTGFSLRPSAATPCGRGGKCGGLLPTDPEDVAVESVGRSQEVDTEDRDAGMPRVNRDHGLVELEITFPHIGEGRPVGTDVGTAGRPG